MRNLLLVFLGISMSTFAATESSTSLSLAKPEGESTIAVPKDETKTSVLGLKKFEEDKRINDLQLRAEAGSLSRLSLKFGFGYSGSAVNNLWDPNRPNPDNRPGDNRTTLSGSANLRYRINPNTAATFGTGLVFFTPYQAAIGQEVDRPKDKKNYGVNNPTIGLDRTYRVANTQMMTRASVSTTTDADYKKRGQWGAAGLTQYAKWTPYNGKVILGAQIGLDYFAYARDYHPAKQDGPKDNGDGSVSKYYINIIPSVEYKLSDNVNFNTSVGYPYQNLRSDSSWWTWNHPLSTWRVGAGWAITRDIYINPYVNFFLESPAFNTASLNFNTTFSIF